MGAVRDFEVEHDKRMHVIVFFNDTAATEIYTLSLHDALPIYCRQRPARASRNHGRRGPPRTTDDRSARQDRKSTRSELQSQFHLVCRLLLEKKNPNMPWRRPLVTASRPPPRPSSTCLPTPACL